VIVDLVRRGGDLEAHRVRCPADLVQDVAQSARKFPACLPEAASRALRREVIDQALRNSRLGAIGPIATTAGYQRRLASRFEEWTRKGHDPRGPAPALDDAATAAEWALFADYRSRLRQLGAEDEVGFHLAACYLLARQPPTWFRALTSVVIDRPAWDDPLVPHMLSGCRAHEMDVDVLVRFDPARAEVFVDAEEFIAAQMDLGLGPEEIEEDDGRPEGLVGLGRDLFRDDLPLTAELGETDGLTIISAPDGEPLGREIARQVCTWLDAGVAPEDVLVVFRDEGEALDQVARSLKAWGVPVSAPTRRPLAADPGVAALVLAARVPREDWDLAEVVGLLRNGQLDPDWSEVRRDRLALAKASSAVRDLRAYRGRDAILQGLARLADRPIDRTDPDNSRHQLRADRARVALPILQKLVTLLDAEARAGRWDDQVAALARTARGLGIDCSALGLDALFGALDDQGELWAGIGKDDVVLPWPRFVSELEALIRDLPAPAPVAPPSAVRLMLVDEALGLRPRCMVLADLSEGKFPPRSGADRALTPEPSRAYAREMVRFLEMVGLPSEALVLAHPTTDDKGRELLPAGFLDEAHRLYDEKAWQACERPARRADPALLDTPTEDPAEARVRALALAVHRDQCDMLRDLARSARHRAVLLGVADALEVVHARDRGRPLGAYEGRLGQGPARRLAEDFGPGGRVFSPSQLESLAFCPFQFFARYVLRLEPVDLRDEIDSDYAASGRRVHRVLEQLHLRAREMAEGDGALIVECVEQLLPRIIAQVVDEETGEASGLGLIEARRLERTGRRYLRQFRKYMEGPGRGARITHCELVFGRDQEGPGPLRIGDGPSVVAMRGMIDRIDVIETEAGLFFRVIDYKTGKSPSKDDQKVGKALQLPLYALAVERLVFADRPAVPLDVGYWSLKGSGYTKAREMSKDGAVSPDWGPFRLGLEAFVLDLVDRLRAGQLPVAPRATNCESSCDYRHVCRIKDVRSAEKEWPERPVLQAAEAP
jgi:hypothetical protein